MRRLNTQPRLSAGFGSLEQLGSKMIHNILILGFLTTVMALIPVKGNADAIRWSGDKPAPGVYFDRNEPSIYVGFAPRTQDPERVHLELSRGNQLRLTLVLGPDEIDGYLVGLLMRRSVVQALIDGDVIELTTNLAFERFSAAINDALVEDVVLRRDDLGTNAYREQSIAVMERLNPGRVFRIALPFEKLAENWYRTLQSIDPTESASGSPRLGAANAILPGRINLSALTDELSTTLDHALQLVSTGKGAADPAFRSVATDFLARATGGRYPVVDGEVRAIEFTAVYPAGTPRAWTVYNGTELPDLGRAGIWPLLRRDTGRGLTGVVDYLSPSPGYGYIPLLAFESVDGGAYNALYNTGIRTRLDDSPFLPAAWTRVVNERDPDKSYRHLWIGSRGPISGGGIRLPSGHMSELRGILPSSSKALEGVMLYRNLPQCHDVFDFDGDGHEEVIGLAYFLAYQAKGHRPQAAYAANNREGFYTWLYRQNIARRPDGNGSIIKEVPVCRFVGLHNALERDRLHRIPLYEAPYATETIQFYRTKGTDFHSPEGIMLNRELRRVGVDHEMDYEALMLE